MSSNSVNRERLLELLSIRAAEGVSPEQSVEIDALLRDHPDVDPAIFDLPAAGAWLAQHQGALEEMPADLAGRIEAAAIRAGRSAGGEVAGRIDPGPWRMLAITGWLAAAAAIAFGIFTALRPVPVQPVPGLAERRAGLLAAGGDVRTVAWSGATPSVTGVSGDVVWSDQRGEGYARVSGLPVNDTQTTQYQLWVFDPTRPNPDQPVHAGVFDVPAGAGEVIVPISPSLRTKSVAVFAVSREKPGGSVLPTADQVLLVAK